jgi:dTDP-4-amino-4,6-dideoxygalactose transaminase
MIRLGMPSIEDDDCAAVAEALRTGNLVQGERVQTFEQSFARYVGIPNAVAVSNCTAALHLCLLALDVKAGDAVAVTAYSWISTANVIELCGARPVFVDIEQDTFAMSPCQLERALAGDHSIKAILPVHPFGQVADMEAINELALSRHIPVIEDAACALGSTYRGKQAGSMSRAGCFSFHPRKAMTTGEGGMITTSDEEFARRLRALRNHGMDSRSDTVDFIMPGLNYRLTEFQAALGSSQLAKFDRLLAARKRVASVYDALLAGTAVQAPIKKEDRESSYQSYVVLLPSHLAHLRGACIEHMRKAGIQVNIGTYHMPLTTFFQSKYGYTQGHFPVTDEIFVRAMALPLYEGLTVDEQVRVVGTVLTWVRLNE